MHEASLMRDLMRRVETAAREAEAARVVSVDVWLGALSHFSPAHFREHFEQAAAGTVAEGARVSVVVDEDVHHPDAQGVVLRSVELET